MTLEVQLERYAASFPFPRCDEKRIVSIERWLGKSLSPLLGRLFSQIGEGNYWLTGEYFTIDDCGKATKLLLDNLETEFAPLGNAEQIEYADERIEFVSCPYQVRGHELVIAESDAGLYFVEDAHAPHPVVRCWLRRIGVVVDSQLLGDIVAKFSFFSQPRDIPQSIVDYEWFTRNVDLNLNPDLHYRNIVQWVKDGRQGMPSQYHGHTGEVADLPQGDRSILDPGYFLW